MYASQKQVIDSLVRIRAFADAHPASGPLTYSRALGMLDDALEQCDRHAATQVAGPAFGRAARQRQVDLVGQLRDRHMRPIVAIARAQVQPGSDVGLAAGFRMPKASISITKMLASCDAMIEMAREHEALLVEKGLPPDFLYQFASTRDELAASRDRRAESRNSHIAARAGLRVELRRARLAVNQLDAVVRATFRGDDVVLTTWRTMKRVHLLPRGGDRTASASGEAAASSPTVTAAFSPAVALVAA